METRSLCKVPLNLFKWKEYELLSLSLSLLLFLSPRKRPLWPHSKTYLLVDVYLNPISIIFLLNARMDSSWAPWNIRSMDSRERDRRFASLFKDIGVVDVDRRGGEAIRKRVRDSDKEIENLR